MTTYGQFCPVARASEILAERWTPVIVRNLLLGCRSFNEIAAGLPGISRTLLSKRLRELERAGIITIRPKAAGRGSLYELTQAGRELWPVVGALREWGARWVELAPEHIDPGMVLWSWAISVDRDRLPEGRVVVCFDVPSQPSSRRRGWLLISNRDIEVCTSHPGFDEDLIVVVTDEEALVRWHLGQISWEEALRSGAVRVDGPPGLARALPTWHRPDRPSRVERLEAITEAAGLTGPPPASRPHPIPEFAGEVLTPEDEDYDRARRVWNGGVDRRPALILRCASAADVAAGLRFARERDLSVAVRGGGHSFAGLSVCDDGIVLDLSRMKGVGVDPAHRIAEAQPGVVWGELDAATQGFGLATTGGVVSQTGIAGLTLGGGLGWLMRRHGLTVDNLLSAQVVTADGERITASADEDADLFWGLRGGGGNFGVVTRFAYRCHPVGPVVLAGPIMWALEDAGELLRFYRDLAATAPRELATIVALRHAPAAPFLPFELHGRRVCVIGTCYLGEAAAGERALAPLRRFGRPLVDIVDAVPYTGLQASQDASAPPGWHYYGKAAQLGGLDDDVIDAMVAHAWQLPTERSTILLYHLGGAVTDVAKDETAYPWRDAAYSLTSAAAWLPTQRMADEATSWARRLDAAVRPHGTGVYVNFLDRDDRDRVAAAYGEATYRRLAALKDRYDPDNVFHPNQNVPPSTSRPGRRPAGTAAGSLSG